MEDIKIKLSFLWVAHYLIWSFGDFLSLLTPNYIEDEIPVSSNILYTAAIVGSVHAYMIIGSILLNRKQNRLFNLVFSGIFTLINIGNLYEMIADDRPGGLVILALVYISISLIILWHAYKWEPDEN